MNKNLSRSSTSTFAISNECWNEKTYWSWHFCRPNLMCFLDFYTTNVWLFVWLRSLHPLLFFTVKPMGRKHGPVSTKRPSIDRLICDHATMKKHEHWCTRVSQTGLVNLLLGHRLGCLCTLDHVTAWPGLKTSRPCARRGLCRCCSRVQEYGRQLSKRGGLCCRRWNSNFTFDSVQIVHFWSGIPPNI